VSDITKRIIDYIAGTKSVCAPDVVGDPEEGDLNIHGAAVKHKATLTVMAAYRKIGSLEYWSNILGKVRVENTPGTATIFEQPYVAETGGFICLNTAPAAAHHREEGVERNEDGELLSPGRYTSGSVRTCGCPALVPDTAGKVKAMRSMPKCWWRSAGFYYNRAYFHFTDRIFMRDDFVQVQKQGEGSATAYDQLDRSGSFVYRRPN